MATYDFSKFWAPEFAKNWGKFDSFPFNFNKMIEIQRKNFQALTEAQQLALEGLQSTARQQAELVSRIVQDNAALTQELLAEGTPEEKASRQTDLARKNYEASVESWNELTDLVIKTQKEAADIISSRVSASLTELKSALAKEEKEAANKQAAPTTAKKAA